MSAGRVTRWYREPYAWLVFGLPACAVLACLATVAIAVATWDGLVVDDYYKRGLEINRRLARERAAAALGLSADVVIGAHGAARIVLRAGPGFGHPPALEVQFSHATRGGLDRRVTFVHDGGGVYEGNAGPLAAGAWYVDVSTPEWRVVRRVPIRSRGAP